MNLPESTFDNETANIDIEVVSDTSDEKRGEELFPGDLGTLAFETRHALIQLIKGPFLDGRRHSKLWSVLMRDEQAIRKFLCELFLTPVIDYDLQVAYTRQIDTGDIEIPSLLRHVQLSFMATALLLYLRQELAQAGALGERVVVSRDDIIEQLRMYDSDKNTDKSGFDKRIITAINKMTQYNILLKVKSSDDRYEISPTLKLLFSPEEISELTQIYNKIRDTGHCANHTEESTNRLYDEDDEGDDE